MKMISSVLVNAPPQESPRNTGSAIRPDESLMFEIGDIDSDTDNDLLLVEESIGDNDQPVANLVAEGVQAQTVSKMQEQVPSYEINKHFAPTMVQPKYQAIPMTGEDEDVTTPPRRTMGVAAHHGPRFIPAEIKDNLEQWRANTVTEAPRFSVAPPPNLYAGFGL